MNKLINICKNYSGIREDLTEAEETTVLDLIRTEFKTLSAEDVANAFKMNASGKYWKSLEAYQTFSPIYVGKVLQEFKEWKRKKNTIKTIDPAKMIEYKVDPDKSNKEDFEVIERRFREGLPIDGFNFSGAFLHLEKEGLINLTNEDKLKLKQKVESRLKSKINEKRINLTRLPFDLLNSIRPSSIKIECRKTAVIDYLEKL